MARFHLTSDSDTHIEAQETCVRADLDSEGDVNNDGVFLTTYGKRAIDTRNFLRVSDEEFVAVTGTLVVNGKLGEAALHEVHNIYSEAGIEAIRNQGFGQYAVVIRDGDTVIVFCDPNGVYQTYYTDTDPWFVSNSLHLCGQSLDKRIVDRYSLYERIIESTELSSSTLFTDVSRLWGSEKLIVDASAGEMRVESMSYPDDSWSYQNASLEEILDDYTSRTEAVFDQMSKAADGVGIQVTGGLDSRTVLAGLLWAGDKPLILYGVGNSKITNTKEEDLTIARRYANRFDLPFYRMDWTWDYPVDTDEWDALFSRYGFRYRMYGATPSFFREFESGFPGEPELLLNGYGYGIFSNVYYWEDNTQTPISFEDAVTNIFTGAADFTWSAFPCKDEYLNRLVETCRDVIAESERSIDMSKPLDIDELTQTMQLLKGRPQSPYCNVANEFTYHLSPFATYELGQPMIDVPAEFRVGEKMRVKLLRRLYPELLKIPIFSGTRKQKFTDYDELRFAASERLIEYSGSILPDQVVSLLRPIYKHLSDSSYGGINDEIFRTHRERIPDGGPTADCFNLEEYGDHIRRHSRFVLFEHGLNVIGYSDITG